MAVLPTFNPEGRATDAADVANASANTMSSIMERVAQSRRANEEMDMRRQQFEIEKPVRIAEAQSQIATSGAQLASTKRQADLRTQFMSQSPGIMQEYENVASTGYLPPPEDEDGNPIGEGAPDWGSMYDGYQALAAKYAQYSVLPEGKQLIDSFQKAAFDAHANYISDQNMKGHQAIAESNRLAAEARALEAANSRIVVGAGHDAARVQSETIGATSRENVQGERNQGRASSAALGAYEKMAAEIDHASEKEEDTVIKANLRQQAADIRKKALALAAQPATPAEAAPAPEVHVNTSPATETPATEESATPAQAQSAQPSGKLYTIVSGHIQPPVGSPDEVKRALQQAVDDGLLTTDSARAYLISRGFRPKGQ